MKMIDMIRDRRRFSPEAEGAGATGGDDGAAAAAAAAAASAAAGDPAKATGKWFEGDAYSAEERTWLAAKGLAEDDPLAAIPKLVKGHRAAEQRIGKGLETILDRPAKDQPYAEWVAANREALGLPADEKGYEIKPPENWPKDQAWDAGREAKALAIGVKYGVPKEAMQELIALQADAAMEFGADNKAEAAKAHGELMADLEKDWGRQTPAKITLAKQAAELVAEKAGLDISALGNLSDALMDKIGDANTIRFMAAIGAMMSDDAAVGLGKGGPMTMTPAEARQQLATQRAPKGDYYEAVAKNDRAAMDRLQPTINHLTKIAAGG